MKRHPGMFKKGQSGNPKGRPPGPKKEYLDIMANTVTAKKWRAIVEKAVTDASQGNAQARKWLSDYLLGKPVETVKAEITTTALTLAEWRIQAQERRDAC